MYYSDIDTQPTRAKLSVSVFWKQASQPTKVLVASLLVAGVCFLICGLLADQYGWWTTRPYLTNLISGATSGCFGIPFALLILSSLAAQQAAQMQRGNAENLLKGALDSLAAAMTAVTSSRLHDRLDIKLDGLTTQTLDRAEDVTALGSPVPPTRPPTADRTGADSTWPNEDELPTVRHSILELVDAMIELREFLQENLSYVLDMEEHWATTCAQWRFLDEYVKPRIFEQELSWIRTDAAARLDTTLRNGIHPFIVAIPLRDRTIPQMIDGFSRIAESNDETLIEKFSTQVDSDVAQLRREIIELRGQLPRAMRLREALAIAQGRPFHIGLTQGRGLEL